MPTLTLHRRTLTFFWRSNLAVMLGVASGAAALTGALFVGDSIRASLRELAIGRLGNVDQVLTSPRFISDPTTTDAPDPEIGGSIYGVITLEGSVTRAESESTAHRVQILGVGSETGSLDPDWAFAGGSPSNNNAAVNEILADELGLKVGDELLIRMVKPADIARETLLGRRDQTTATLRIPVGDIVPSEGFGSFTLRPRQFYSKNVFVPLDVLQRALGQPGKINTLLSTQSFPNESLTRWLRSRLKLEDLGLRVRVDRERGYAALESSAFLVEPAVEETTSELLRELNYPSGRVLTYLANSIETRHESGKLLVPYSTVAAIDGLENLPQRLKLKSSDSSSSPAAGEIWLNEWTATDLQVRLGDPVTMTFFVTGRFGELETRSAEFTLTGIVEMDPTATDPGFTPDFPGVTDTENLADWDPPFPVDLKLVRDQDEKYWDDYRTSPKAFISLEDGRRLWAEQGERFGRLTSIRFSWPSEQAADSVIPAFESTLMQRLPLEALGLRFDPIRDRLLQAAEGSTDFGMLFIGFSFFLVISAAMLVALLFRLGVERRCNEIGLLLATGFPKPQVARFMLIQGVLIAVIGTLIGLVGAIGYGHLMLRGLSTWWSAAVNAPFLKLHVTPVSAVIGSGISIMIAVAAIAGSVRGLTRKSPMNLLSGNLDSATARTTRKMPVSLFIAMIAALGAILLVIASATAGLSPTGAFFGAGALALVALICGFNVLIHHQDRGALSPISHTATLQLGLRQAARRRSRSLLIVGLVASASFIISAMEALRLQAGGDPSLKESGSGGFSLLAESAVPLSYDLNTEHGRESLNATTLADDEWSRTRVQAFRLQAGDETSCLNLYRPTRPRILGAPDDMIQRGGFAFAGTMTGLPATNNPWGLLDHVFDDGAIPVIGDEAAVMWQLKSGLGKDFIFTDERNRETKLRFVALLRGSVLQSELIVAEDRFLQLFPSSSGYSFFLIESTAKPLDPVERGLEKDLRDYGFDVETTSKRLNEYLAVQNTYLGTFQSLGGLGLALGTIGLAAVVLRNTWERRGEFALMRAIGFPQAQLFWLVFMEHALLVIGGLFAGVLAAAIAIAPQASKQPQQIAWFSLTATLLLVFLTGMTATALATLSSLRTPLLASLRRE